MTLTVDDMRAALRGQNKAEEAIFWFGHFWNSGPESDLYKAMIATNFHPTRAAKHKQIANDPEILYCSKVLMDQYVRRFGYPREYALQPFKLSTIQENDVVVCGPGRQFACIDADWPLRVHLWRGDLSVYCAEDLRFQYHHPLKEGPDGFVVGFRR